MTSNKGSVPCLKAIPLVTKPSRNSQEKWARIVVIVRKMGQPVYCFLLFDAIWRDGVTTKPRLSFFFEF